MKKKLEFLVPLMSKQASGNWDHTCKMLNFTLNSLYQIAEPEFQITLIGHDFPDTLKLKENCRWIKAQSNPPSGNSLAEKMQDKGEKLRQGVVNSFKEDRVESIMFIDADDFVSKEILQNIPQQKYDAVCFERGFEWNIKNKTFLKLNYFHKRCGSSWIFRLNSNLFPTWLGQNNNLRICDQAHQDRLESLLTNKNSVSICNKPSVVYVVDHGANSMDNKKTKNKKLKTLIKKILFSKRISQKIISEFKLPSYFDIKISS